MREMIRPTLVLFIICLAVGTAMAFTNSATADKIAQRIVEDAQTARRNVIPEADSFIKLDMTRIQKALPKKDSDVIWEAYLAKKNGNNIGYVFLAKPKGYAGEINVMVGIASDGSVSGVEIGDNKETPGLGSKAKDKEFKGQFYGKKYDAINVVKRRPQKDDEVQAISGATITSKAVSRGVQQASRIAAALLNKELGVTDDELVEDNK